MADHRPPPYAGTVVFLTLLQNRGDKLSWRAGAYAQEGQI